MQRCYYASVSAFFLFAACGGSVDGGGIGDNGTNLAPDGSTVSRPDSGAGFPDAQQQKPARGPCTVTDTRAGGATVYEYGYNEDGLQVSRKFTNNTTSTASTVVWSGLTATETSGLTTVNREYAQTDKGLRIRQVVAGLGTSSETVTVFQVDSAGNYVSAKTTGTMGETLTRTFLTTSTGLIKEVGTTSNVVGNLREKFAYTNEMMAGYDWDLGDNGSIEYRFIYERDGNGQLTRSSKQTLNAAGAVVSTTDVRDYSYFGECDYVHEGWYLTGLPGLEL